MTPMTPLHDLDARFFVLVAPDTLGDDYEPFCTKYGVEATPTGHGIIMGIRPDGTNASLIGCSPGLIRDIVAAPAETRDGLQFPEGTFLAEVHGWPEVPLAAILLIVEKAAPVPDRVRVLRIGPGVPTRRGIAIHPIEYVVDGEIINHGFARGDQLPDWRLDFSGGGWQIDDQTGTFDPLDDDAALAAEIAIASGGVHAYGDPFDGTPDPTWRLQLESLLEAGYARITGPRTEAGLRVLITTAGARRRGHDDLTPTEALALTQIAGNAIYAPGELFPLDPDASDDEVAEVAQFDRLINGARAYITGPREHPFGWPVCLHRAKSGAR